MGAGIVKCLTCKNPAKRRGLCDACYAQAARRVQKGDAEWGQLEKAGLCLPRRRRRGGWNKKADAALEGGK